MMAGRPELPLILRKPFLPFADHRRGCTQCWQVDLQRGATLALACIEGAKLLKGGGNMVWHADRPKRARRAGAAP